MYGKYGEVSYKYGKPVCHICGKYFDKLMTHVRQKHNMTAYEYKKEFGLDVTKGIVSERYKELKRQKVMEHYDLCIKQNLIKKGAGTRYQKGSPGRTRDKMSYQTKMRLVGGIKSGVTSK